MSVFQPAVLVRVRVRFPRWVAGLMRMLMMRIVHVRMRMHGRHVDMLVFMPFGQVKPNAEPH